MEINIELRKKKAKNNFKRDFFKLMNNSALQQTMENVKQVETSDL